REAHWNVAGVARVGAYGEVERRVLLGLKYRGHERNAGVLAEWLAEALARQPWGRELEALVPVPMHWLRRLQRPCDHARVLAEALGRRLNLPVVRLVRRARHSPSQTGMTTKTQRFENVKGCFAPPLWWLPAQGPWAWRRGRLAARVAGRTVCIIDNLLVTGATVTEVSKVLRRAGARRIYVAVVSRAPSPGDAPAGAPPALVAGADSAAGEPAAAPGWFEL
ncbi:MAG: phosphoribosyltransferase family protein, partial [Planctomycetota bacterium]